MLWIIKVSVWNCVGAVSDWWVEAQDAKENVALNYGVWWLWACDSLVITLASLPFLFLEVAFTLMRDDARIERAQKDERRL